MFTQTPSSASLIELVQGATANIYVSLNVDRVIADLSTFSSGDLVLRERVSGDIVDQSAEINTLSGSRAFNTLTFDDVEGDNNVIINNDNPDRLGYTGEHLIPILVRGLQEQQEVINDLKARIETLEA